MTAFHEQAVAQLMRTGRVELRDEGNGNLYVSNQWDGTYKILAWDDYACNGYAFITNRDGALEEIYSWCVNLEKLLSL